MTTPQRCLDSSHTGSGKGPDEKVPAFHCLCLPQPSQVMPLGCLKGSVESFWSAINVVKSWLYGVDLLLL
jgi:hypothetical protein